MKVIKFKLLFAQFVFSYLFPQLYSWGDHNVAPLIVSVVQPFRTISWLTDEEPVALYSFGSLVPRPQTVRLPVCWHAKDDLYLKDLK